LIVYAGEPEQYTSFITPEAYNALQEWIDYRKENGENIESESWVMRHNWAFKYRLGAEQPEQLSIHGVKKLLNRALWEQGLRKPLNGSRRHEFKESHGFRKFFKTRSEHAGMKPINVEIMMGHKVGISDHYYRPREQELLEDYLRAVDNLTGVVTSNLC
jgi:integrase